MPPLPSSRQSKADSGSGAADHRNPHSRYYLSEYAEKQIIKKHQKPVLDEYHKDLSALRQRQAGAQPTQAGLTDQNRLEEAAKAKCQAGLKAVQSAITQELKPLEDRIISEYDLFVRKHDIEQEENKLATLLRDNASRGRRRPVRFTREEKAKAEEDWEAERLASGLPIEGDLDDLDPGEVARGQTEGKI